MSRRGRSGRGRSISTAFWFIAIVLGFAALQPGFRHLAQKTAGPDRAQIRLLLLFLPLVMALLAGARNWKGWREETRFLKDFLPDYPRFLVAQIAGLLWFMLAVAWAAVFSPLVGLYLTLFGRGAASRSGRRVTPEERQAQEHEARRSGVLTWFSVVGPVLFLAVAGSVAVTTHTTRLFPVAAVNLIVSFWANGLWANYMWRISAEMETSDVTTEIVTLKRARVVGLGTAIVGAGLLAAV